MERGKVKFFIITILIIGLCLAMVACRLRTPQLNAPKNLHINSASWLEWDPVHNAEEYNVFFKASLEDEFEFLATTHRTDISVSNFSFNLPHFYIFKVEAVADGYKSNYSVFETYRPSQLQSPQNLSVPYQSVLWSPVIFASSYEIYVQHEGCSDFEFAAALTNTWININRLGLLPGKNIIRVRALAEGFEDSDFAELEIVAPNQLSAPEDLEYNDGFIRFVNSHYATSYRAYVRSGDSEGFTLLGTSFGTSLRLYGVTAGKNTVIVQALAEGFIDSGFSVLEFTLADKLETPTNLELRDSSGSLRWRIVNFATSYVFHIQRSGEDDFEYFVTVNIHYLSGGGLTWSLPQLGIDRLNPGTNIIRIQAVADGFDNSDFAYLEIDMSSKLVPPSNLRIEDDGVRWDQNGPFAFTNVYVKYPDADDFVLARSTGIASVGVTFDHIGLLSGKNIIRVQAVGNGFEASDFVEIEVVIE